MSGCARPTRTSCKAATGCHLLALEPTDTAKRLAAATARMAEATAAQDHAEAARWALRAGELARAHQAESQQRAVALGHVPPPKHPKVGVGRALGARDRLGREILQILDRDPDMSRKDFLEALRKRVGKSVILEVPAGSGSGGYVTWLRPNGRQEKTAVSTILGPRLAELRKLARAK